MCFFIFIEFFLSFCKPVKELTGSHQSPTICHLLGRVSLVFALLISLPVWAQTEHSHEYVFTGDDINLSPNMQYLPVTHKKWTLKQVLAQQDGWQQVHKSSLNFGFDHRAYWLRVKVHNPSNKDLNLILNTCSEVVDFIDVYVLDEQHNLLYAAQTGDRREFASRPLHTPTFTFPIFISQGQSVQLYLRLDSHDGLHEAIKPVLQSNASFISSEDVYGLIYGTFFGLLFSMIIYNLFLFVSVKDVDYGFYSLYIFVFLLWSLTLKGYGFKYLWPMLPNFNNIILALTALLMPVSLTAFLVRYLNLKRNSPRVYKQVVLLTYASLFIIPFIFLDFYTRSFALIFPYDMFSVLVAVIYTTYLVLKKYREAYYVLASFSLLALSIFIYSLMIVGGVEKNILTDNMPLIGAGLEVMLLAFGLADKVNLLQKKHRETERQARLAQLSINEKLSEQVAERTKELETLNNELYRLSVIDELTQVFNRRMFNQRLAHKLTNADKEFNSFALCVIDIDYFKHYNDLYGHQEGDKALIMVSRCMQSFEFTQAKASFYRIGGEEFAILIAFNAPTVTIIDEIKSLNWKVQGLQLTHEKSPYGIVTISQGLLLLEQTQGRPNEVFKQADDLLYQAKEQGRNRTVFKVIHTDQ